MLRSGVLYTVDGDLILTVDMVPFIKMLRVPENDQRYSLIGEIDHNSSVFIYFGGISV